MIVEEDKLDELLSCCRKCAGRCVLTKFTQGAYICYKAKCMEEGCAHEYEFETTPKVSR